MKPDLDAIRARWAKRGHSFDDRDEFERGARTDIPALLAYIDDLEHERDNMRRIRKRTQDEIKHIDEMSWKELRSNLRLANEELASLRPALHRALCEIEELKARIVTLEAMR